MAFPAHLSIVLHAHLPFIRHPEHDYHLEEMWFYEAMHETYLPLLQMLDRLEKDDISGAMTLSLSAPLLAMMGDYLLRERFIAHLDRLVDFCESEVARTKDDARLEEVATFYHRRFTGLREYFVDELNGDVIGAFRHHGATKRLELMTCVGTHPILPFLATDAGKRAQLRVGLDHFEACFGERPRGVWIAECAFAPGVDRILADEGISFSCLEEVAITCAESAPIYGTYSPLISDGGVAFFGRDRYAAAQVWSAGEGYPGDPVYREFYRDRGYDLPMEAVEPYIHPDGIRHDTGLKYHRITGDVALDDKEVYRPQQARQRVREHAAHFVDSRLDQVDAVADSLGDRPAHITCPYDAELFGHWWFEGPLFIEEVFRQAAQNSELRLSTPVEFLREVDAVQQSTPATSSWGENSYFSVWLDESNASVYRHLRNAEYKMVELAENLAGDVPALEQRALDQAARELMLAQASDWPFIIKTGTTVEYARQRLDEHLSNFQRLSRMIDDGEIDEAFLQSVEHRHNLFAEINAQYWCKAG